MTSALRILLVDDSESSLVLVSAFLTDIEHQLTTCINGKEALDTFMNQDFDIVLMDVMMPIMDGLQATIAIRAFEKENDQLPTPILLLSGNDTPDEITRYAQVGINAFLPKPLLRDTLLEAINTHALPF